jgi:hypothetical protein
MSFVEDKIIFDTPGMLERLTQPEPYKLPYQSVLYKTYDGDEVDQSGLLVDDKMFFVPENELIINNEARTIEFEAYENRYIVRPYSAEELDEIARNEQEEETEADE